QLRQDLSGQEYVIKKRPERRQDNKNPAYDPQPTAQVMVTGIGKIRSVFFSRKSIQNGTGAAVKVIHQGLLLRHNDPSTAGSLIGYSRACSGLGTNFTFSQNKNKFESQLCAEEKNHAWRVQYMLF